MLSLGSTPSLPSEGGDTWYIGGLSIPGVNLLEDFPWKWSECRRCTWEHYIFLWDSALLPAQLRERRVSRQKQKALLAQWEWGTAHPFNFTP